MFDSLYPLSVSKLFLCEGSYDVCIKETIAIRSTDLSTIARKQ